MSKSGSLSIPSIILLRPKAMISPIALISYETTALSITETVETAPASNAPLTPETLVKSLFCVQLTRFCHIKSPEMSLDDVEDDEEDCTTELELEPEEENELQASGSAIISTGTCVSNNFISFGSITSRTSSVNTSK